MSRASNPCCCELRRDPCVRPASPHGKAERVWVMDRGVPTEEVLAEMRASTPPVRYIVGTPKGRLSRLEKSLLELPWQSARPEVKVKLLKEDQELCVFVQSEARVAKERAIRRRKLKRLWKRLRQPPEPAAQLRALAGQARRRPARSRTGRGVGEDYAAESAG